MRILIRTSRWAIWARRFAAFAMAVTITSIALHVTNNLESEPFSLLLALGSAIGAIAALTGFGALIRLWWTGDRGWGHGFMALFVGLICATPAIYAGAMSVIYPTTNAVTTDPNASPELLTAAAGNLNLPADYAVIRAAFPNAVTRSYRIATSVAYQEARKLIEAKGMRITVERQPTEFGRAGQINAAAFTLLRFEDEFAVSFQSRADEVVVNVVSASTSGKNDYGTNGRRVEDFLLSLDAAISEIIKSGLADEAALAEPLEETAETGEDTDAELLTE